ncbi:hypothetical protein P3T27_005795 [Kitasatospora sp. MAA19]|uniref:hypothetical protein n=1 Tax=unclassified Kitasatospora TaxID=2633591 RepID=UPI002473858C|nr:hypothetical protein [Kitasatospora sp. MAA19]MDH6709049.1 hypothetical protein [Kitasatospora sp. MAA19]
MNLTRGILSSQHAEAASLSLRQARRLMRGVPRDLADAICSDRNYVAHGMQEKASLSFSVGEYVDHLRGAARCVPGTPFSEKCSDLAEFLADCGLGEAGSRNFVGRHVPVLFAAEGMQVVLHIHALVLQP